MQPMRTIVAGPLDGGQRRNGNPRAGQEEGGITLPAPIPAPVRFQTGLKGPRKRRKTMSRETTNAGKLGKLQRLSSALAANGGEIPHLETSRAMFDALLAKAQDAAKQQA